MIAIGSDHGGVELKDYLVAWLRSQGADVRDFGTHGDESVDYPDFGREVSLRVARGEAERGILICTSGIGMSIAANKFPRVRPPWWRISMAPGPAGSTMMQTSLFSAARRRKKP